MRIAVSLKKFLIAGGVLGGVVGGVTAALVAWSGGPGDPVGPRPLTSDEAQRMALARFHAYRASPSAVTVRSVAPGGTVVVTAVVDQRAHRAVGEYRTAGTRGLLAWDLADVGVARRGGAPGAPGDVLRAVRAVGERQWTRRRITRDPLDVGLRLALSLAADRPDNAQLLAQSGPLWLREERIDGRSYGVFSGPRPRPASGGAPPVGRSPLTYWIDADGTLRRVTADLGPGRSVTVDITAGKVPGKVPEVPWKHQLVGREG
ncbi:hypothetical protein SAMN04487983_102247 [Streptomyces sp. yr375]|uniref:hypothetical protein n=1 Tax=Streptomyces sp. yr375 TaxID=1761906 RepID=UPI0008BD7A5A|nr:hypothetical protein [Streptomyces sp. yr375]SER78619.1 hypothetical protein SAMN04487983_102247 [Streptomyces sp. yr375]